MRIWLAFIVLVGTPIFVGTLSDVVRNSHYISGDQRVGLIVPPLLVLFGTVLPKFGRLLGKKGKKMNRSCWNTSTTRSRRASMNRIRLGSDYG